MSYVHKRKRYIHVVRKKHFLHGSLRANLFRRERERQGAPGSARERGREYGRYGCIEAFAKNTVRVCRSSENEHARLPVRRSAGR